MIRLTNFYITFRYLEAFLLTKDNYAPAYKLLGQISEAMNSPDQALAAYKRSLELDEKQKDVLIKSTISW
jgi:tetratricopeptide (TPR) repeat protein